MVLFCIIVLFLLWGAVATYKHELESQKSKIDAQAKHISNLEDRISKIGRQRGGSDGVHVIANLPDYPNQDEESKNDDDLTLILDPGEWYQEVTLNPQEMTMSFRSHTPDYDTENHAMFEYKFEGEQLIARCIEDFVSHYGEQDWNVRDGVVLESEIKKQCDNNKFKNLERSLERHRESLNWHPFTRADLRYFAMLKHPNLFEPKNVRRKLRTDLERLKLAREKAITRAGELGLLVEETEEGIEIRFPDNLTEERIREVQELFGEEFLRSIGTSWDELLCVKKYEKNLTELIEQNIAA